MMHNKQTTIYRRILSITLLLLLQGLGLNLTSQQQSNAQQSVADTTNIQAQYASLPLAFEPNQGQMDGGAQFLVHHGQATTYFKGVDVTTSIGNDRITMSLDGANTPSFTGTDPLQSRTNYFIGNDQSKWHSDVPNFKEIVAKNVYPGIDLKYYGTNSQLEHDFIVKPGADPAQIAFHLDGQKNVTLDSDGNLILKAGESDLRFNAPTTYQQTENSKRSVPSHFELNDNTVTIALAADYDHSQPLIIDPVLIYSTYFGGTGSDYGVRNVLDPDGNVYVIGMATSAGFPTTAPFQATYGGGTFDAVVIKFSKTGSGPIYATYLGGSGDDRGTGIATDIAGNAYVSGLTDSTNFPMSAAFQGAKGTGQDAFLTKLNPTGSALTYSTYFGGNGNDFSQNLTVDSLGQAYLVGDTDSTNLPTVSAVQPTAPGNGDSFVAKFNASASALIYATYVGGAASGEQTFGITINSAGNAYLTGYTYSSNFPTVAAFQPANAGGIYEAFVAELSTDGSSFVFSTYLGGSGDDEGSTITLDSAGNIYVTGQTDSTNFPTASPYQASLAGSRDAFITKFNSSASALLYSTYLGGSGSDVGSTIVVDSSNNAYVIGQTSSTNFPVVSPYQAVKGVGFDTFLTKLNSAGSTLTYSTYLGGNGTDAGLGIAIRLDGDIFISGYTSSSNFPTANAYQASNVGQDIFFAQFSDHSVTVTGLIQPSLSFSIGSTTCNMGFFSATQTQYCTHTMSAGSNATGGYVISYIPTTTLTSGASTITAMSSQTASVVGTEQYGMNLKANTSAGSFTSANFGANPSGGSGTAMSGYQTADLFKFATGGDNIAQTTGASTPTTYTVSFIANITIASEAGTYSTPVTYNIVASY